MSYGKLTSLTRTVAFRLSLWYAAVFSGSILVSFVIFYFALLRGIHHVDLSPRSLHELLEAYWSFFGTALGVVLIGSLFVGWFMAKRALAGVGEVTRTALSIAGADLDKLVPVKGTNDEIDQLARAFNDMLGRIKTVLQSTKEITDNIAHDLRSPIARMRGIAEMTLGTEDAGREHTIMAGTVVEECDRLLGMINTMLDISEAEAGLAKPNLEPVDLVTLLRDTCDLFEPVAEDRSIGLAIDSPESLLLSGDRSKLQRVFANLLDNALKYTPPGGQIRISANAAEGEAQVTVKDTGSGIPEDELPHIFDRFFRGERSRSAPGNGLGLSLAHAFVLIHGGTVTVRSESDRGTEFTVTLPRKVQLSESR